MNETKQCPNCYIIKPASEFGFRSVKKDRLQSYCKECQSEWQKKHRKDNIEFYRDRGKEYEKVRLQKVANGEMPHRKEAMLIRKRNNNTLRQISVRGPANMKEETFLNNFGCSKKTFIARFEKEFEKNPGMSWTNYGAWHMDHIKPLGLFTLDTTADRKLANHYTNVRPIWATTNLEKAAKYEVEQKV